MVQSRTRSKDLKYQKLQTCLLKVTGVIGNVANALLTLRSNKLLKEDKKSIVTQIHSCTDSIAMLSQVNAELEQTRRDAIVGTLDKNYRQLSKIFLQIQSFYLAMTSHIA